MCDHAECRQLSVSDLVIPYVYLHLPIFKPGSHLVIYSEHYWFSRHAQMAKVAVHIVLSKHGA